MTLESLQFRGSDSCTDSSIFICTINMIEFRYFTIDEYADDYRKIRFINYDAEIPEISK